MKSKVSVRNILLGILVLVGVLFIIWFGISFIDVIVHNSTESIGPQLSWNLFKVFNFQ